MAQVDPRSFGDSLALRTQWGPLFRPGAVPLGRPGWHLHEASASRVELRRALDPLPVAVFAAPALLMLWPLAMHFGASAAGAPSITDDLVLALLWLVLGLWLFRPAVFDRDHGAFWIGWFAPARPGDRGSCALNQIQALQLLRLEMEVRQQNRPAQKLACYQLNLVLLDAQRRCVAMSLDLAQLRGDAAKLQRFLSCRLWDASAAAAAPPGTTARAMAAPARRPATLGAPVRDEPRQGSARAAMTLLAGAALGIWLLADSSRLAQLAEEYRRLVDDTPALPEPEPPPAAEPVSPERVAKVQAPAVAPAPLPAPPAAAPARVIATAPGNLVADPSLESGSAEWAVHDRGTDVRAAWTADAAASGRHALALQASRAGGQGWPGWLSRARFRLDPASRYMLRAKAMTPDGASAWIEAGYFDARGTWLGGTSSGCTRAVPPHGQWRELEHRVALGSFPGAVEVQLGLRQCLTFTAGQPTTLYFDDVHFGMDAPAAPPAAPAAAGEPTELAQCANVAPERRAQCAFGFFVAQACRGETAPAANAACRARERAKYGVPEP